VLKVYADSTGPKISSRTTVESEVTPVSTVGLMNRPPRPVSAAPP
jgi:hypothetical protein